MNLVDIIDTKYGLQQDEWSLEKPRFGKENQLEVLGWSGRRGGHKLYIVRCGKCLLDTELFGDAYFKSNKGNLERGKSPCGCAANYVWTKEQYITLCSQKAETLGYTFIGFHGDWKGARTKIQMSCPQHGDWFSGSINKLISSGRGCVGCMGDAISVRSIKPDSIMIQSFFDSGCFHPETTFYRSERRGGNSEQYWFVGCPDCGEMGESSSGSLQQGRRSCACSPHRQQEAYINLVKNSDSQIVAIKFGIANNSFARVKQQNSKCFYEVINHSVYIFPDKKSCLKAERECLKELTCGVLSKKLLPDGYTETTDVLNLVRIKRIYEKRGGVLLTEPKVIPIISEFLN